MTEHEYKKAFFQAHNNDWHVETSQLYGERGDHYMKTYICADGAQMSEVNGPEWRDADIMVSGVRVGSESVRVWVTELWTTDNPTSVKYVSRY